MAIEQDLEPPHYGPLETPSHWAEKWHAKVRDLFARYYLDQPNPQDPKWIVRFAEDAYEHFHNFMFQAQQLSLNSNDFPTPSYAEPALERNILPPLDLPADHINPFEAASLVVVHMYGALQRLERMKLGEKLLGVAWQSLPLKYRQCMNDVLEEVKGENGHRGWKLPESVCIKGKEVFDRIVQQVELGILQARLLRSLA